MTIKPSTTNTARCSTRRLVRPLVWEPHHVRDNGWYGCTSTGHKVLYVYQPWDNRIKRGPMPWVVHVYFGCTEKPLRYRDKSERRYKRAAQAKAAAQAWWRREVLKLLKNPNSTLNTICADGGTAVCERKRIMKTCRYFDTRYGRLPIDFCGKSATQEVQEVERGDPAHWIPLCDEHAKLYLDPQYRMRVCLNPQPPLAIASKETH